ncbi:MULTISPECIES: dTDP-4-dehydrorhamnose 3,5-epimerase [Bradyrhizobium]|uniref:dTDP-4-dehydrorhamnose 3,5-epimerase n=1 Tax=Bradyrhizobium TaxID=374 RepID=UPI0009B6D9BA|nr:dTDP-4-dehydrorhamnose 3,5-epimerase [Bradyrhizobium elkanii]MCS3524546.1 dTDP-4-dehydrorhamnose 3,5-epimerase [Bradyrhizobium elkanii]MCS4072201.1 dTDP-4-dehydrorhamnose 3,5-epimerase [Bradyrhizobium elkanii]MCS4078835.1 dTDP-4-dehydrorhamnose 3,5-epimerase [Bradyrhizobium elkanii]MCW2122567.1 dTDP-4-dehydrorhamnose 3,5-epimerase [Bradyrhizobium elkanii]MCW2169314.1 dTDP-4-dehydrorhamnose 3,5-epimerase [Bradyrhizobium elkanii]
MVEIRRLALDGVLEIVPPKFGDDRGFFSETYNAESLGARGVALTFVQDNHSFSAASGVLRGLHYQLPPKPQAKLVRVVRGRIFDVAVDIRRGSPSFAKWVGLELSAERWNQVLLPSGFAHGFVTLEPNTEVIYKVTDYYSPSHDRSIRFDDPTIGIEWPFEKTRLQLSAKDSAAPLLAEADVFQFENR